MMIWALEIGGRGERGGEPAPRQRQTAETTKEDEKGDRCGDKGACSERGFSFGLFTKLREYFSH